MRETEDKSEIFWTFKNEAIKEFFEEFKQTNGYSNFEFTYNWSRIPEIEDYLTRLFYSSYSRNKEIREHLPELIHDVEEFFASGIETHIITRKNIAKILKDLKDEKTGFRSIEPLPEKGWYGKSIEDRIQINLNMSPHKNSPKLNKDEIRRLYIFHEMGHKILNISKNELAIETYLSTLEPLLIKKGSPKPDTDMKETAYNGFLMIEECLVQELAEKLAYYSVGKERPPYTLKQQFGSVQKYGMESCEVNTNHDYYGIFQEPTINFGRTLRGCCGLNTSNEDILKGMIKKALNTNFVEEVIKEYNHKDGGAYKAYQDLFILLRSMGLLQIQKYATFGAGKTIYGVLATNCMKAVETVSKRNLDLRPYPFGGFPKVEYPTYQEQNIRQPQMM